MVQFCTLLSLIHVINDNEKRYCSWISIFQPSSNSRHAQYHGVHLHTRQAFYKGQANKGSFPLFPKRITIFPLNDISQQITILPYFQWCQIVRDQPNRWHNRKESRFDTGHENKWPVLDNNGTYQLYNPRDSCSIYN